MILDYIKGFLTLFLLMKILQYFVPKNVFQKYISFFSGVVLLIGMLSPFLQGIGKNGEALVEAEYKKWETELIKIADEAEKIKAAGEVFLPDSYGETDKETQEIKEVVVETIKIENGTQAGEEDE